MRIGVASAIVVASLAACSSGAGDDGTNGSRAESSSPSPSPSPSPSQDIVAVPVTKARQPSDFPGDDEDYLRQVHRYLREADVATQMNDRTLVTFGRQFCAILSGGGMLAGKVDFWGGTVQIESGPDVAIFVAAWDIYCPELADGYKRIRGGSQSRQPTVPQRADFARFVMTLHQPEVVPAAEAMSTREFQRTAAAYCTTSADPGWPRTPEVNRAANRLPSSARVLFLVGLTLGFCPETREDLQAVLGIPDVAP